MADYTEMDWNSPISDEPMQELLPEGDYDFMIDHFDRAWFDGSEKIKPCLKAVIYFNIAAPGGEETQIRENFLLTQKLQWRITQLFISVGLMKEGQKNYMPEWEKLPGLTGHAKITLDPDRNNPEKKYNHIKEFYPKKLNNFSSTGF